MHSEELKLNTEQSGDNPIVEEPAIKIQFALLGESSDEEAAELIERDSALFREHLKQHPEIVNDFKDDPEKTLGELKAMGFYNPNKKNNGKTLH